jgi:hypothetical protein
MAYSLATACLISVPLVMLIGAIGNFTGAYRYPASALLFFILLCALLVAGLASGIAALIGILKHGTEGILWKSLIGLLLILIFASLGVSGIVISRAEKRVDGKPPEAPQPPR